MIERLQASLRALANEPLDADPADDARLRDECADALRLALDCMQNELTRSQRDGLSMLNEMLEDDPAPDRAAVRRAARDASFSLGIL